MNEDDAFDDVALEGIEMAPEDGIFGSMEDSLPELDEIPHHSSAVLAPPSVEHRGGGVFDDQVVGSSMPAELGPPSPRSPQMPLQMPPQMPPVQWADPMTMPQGMPPQAGTGFFSPNVVEHHLGASMLTAVLGAAAGGYYGGAWGALAGSLFGGAAVNVATSLSGYTSGKMETREAVVSGTYGVVAAGIGTAVWHYMVSSKRMTPNVPKKKNKVPRDFDEYLANDDACAIRKVGP